MADNNKPTAKQIDPAAQIRRERDMAVGQLHSIGKELGEKMDDVAKVVRCRDCACWDRNWEPVDKGLKLHWCRYMDHSTFGHQYCDQGMAR